MKPIADSLKISTKLKKPLASLTKKKRRPNLVESERKEEILPLTL
jgi:hypothetical protein